MSVILRNYPYDALQHGQEASLKRRLTMKDIELFAYVSGDINPAHLDREYAKTDLFHQIVGHGMWTGALISAVLGTRLPGPGTIYLEQTLQFTFPVMLGDEVTATVRVKKKLRKGRVVMECWCANQHGDVVVKGEALVLAPQEKIERAAVELPDVELRPHLPSAPQRD